MNTTESIIELLFPQYMGHTGDTEIKLPVNGPYSKGLLTGRKITQIYCLILKQDGNNAR